MRVGILDDIHNAYEATSGVHRLRDRAEVRIFTKPFGEPSALRDFDAPIANRERTRFTRELLGQLPNLRIIALMKKTSFLINTARGPIVDELALCVALSSGHIAGAGLDVFDKEPLPAGHPLTKISNVVLTSHLGWPTDEMYSQFADAAADILLAHAEGKEVPRFVTAH